MQQTREGSGRVCAHLSTKIIFVFLNWVESVPRLDRYSNWNDWRVKRIFFSLLTFNTFGDNIDLTEMSRFFFVATFSSACSSPNVVCSIFGLLSTSSKLEFRALRNHAADWTKQRRVRAGIPEMRVDRDFDISLRNARKHSRNGSAYTVHERRKNGRLIDKQRKNRTANTAVAVENWEKSE